MLREASQVAPISMTDHHNSMYLVTGLGMFLKTFRRVSVKINIEEMNSAARRALY